MKEVINVATIPHELARQTWASLAISVMWLAVLFDALFGPDRPA